MPPKFYAELFFKVLNRLDKGHLHTKLEVPRLTCLGLELGGEHYRKEPFGTSAYEHATKENACESMFMTWTPWCLNYYSFIHLK